jgi:hypothetical protein
MIMQHHVSPWTELLIDRVSLAVPLLLRIMRLALLRRPPKQTLVVVAVFLLDVFDPFFLMPVAPSELALKVTGYDVAAC